MTSEVRRIRYLRGTQAEWDAADPILAAGEIGLEMDHSRYKVGVGHQQWTELPYWIDPGSNPGAQGPQGPQGPPGPTIIDGGGP
jgi:hypothetical protein